jgi:hypothetical protein
MRHALHTALLACTLAGASLVAQRPSIMVIPSDRYLIAHGYYDDVVASGRRQRVPSYERAFQEDRHLRSVIAAIAGAFQDRGFPLRDLEAAMRTQREASALDATGRRSLLETARDVLIKRARPDIALDLDFAEEQQMGETSVTFTLRALDAFTSNEVASTTGTGQPASAVPLAVLLKEAVVQRMPQFESRLTGFFEDMVANGRQIRLRIRVAEDAGLDLEAELGGKQGDPLELADHIRQYVKRGAVAGLVQPGARTENLMEFTTVRIPLTDDDQLPLDADTWANRAVVRQLRTELGIVARRESVGLGDVTVIITRRN